MSMLHDPLPALTSWANTRFGVDRTAAVAAQDFCSVASELLRELFRENFQTRYDAYRPLLRTPDDSYWEGLRALSLYWARAIETHVYKELHQSKRSLDFETCALLIFAGLRRLAGKMDEPPVFAADWTQNTAFMRAWANAVEQAQRHDAKLLALFVLALEWDTAPIPLRYFTDDAAIFYLNAYGWREFPQFVKTSNYRNNYRAKDGLGLDGNKWPGVVTISRQGLARAERAVESRSPLFVELEASVSKGIAAGLRVKDVTLGPEQSRRWVVIKAVP